MNIRDKVAGDNVCERANFASVVSTLTPRLVKLYGVRLLFKHPLQLCIFATASFRVDFEKNGRFDTKFLFLQFAADNMNSVSKLKKNNTIYVLPLLIKSLSALILTAIVYLLSLVVLF